MINEQVNQQNIIKALNLEDLPDEKKAELLNKMVEVVEKRLTLRLIKEMNQDDRREFEKILDDDPQKMSDFLGQIFPNFIEIVQHEVESLKKEIIEKAQEEEISALEE